MIQKTSIIHALTGQTGVVVSSIYRNPEIESRTHVPIQVSITAGTATVSVEGRVGPGEPWIVLSALSASDIILVPANLELRSNVTAATGATIRVVTDRQLLFVA